MRRLHRGSPTTTRARDEVQRDHRARRRRHAPLQKTHGVRALAEGDYHGLPATVLVELDPRGLAPLWRWRVRVGDRAADSGAVTADEATAVREAFAALAALREGEKRETPPA